MKPAWYVVVRGFAVETRRRRHEDACQPAATLILCRRFTGRRRYAFELTQHPCLDLYDRKFLLRERAFLSLLPHFYHFFHLYGTFQFSFPNFRHLFLFALSTISFSLHFSYVFFYSFVASQKTCSRVLNCNSVPSLNIYHRFRSVLYCSFIFANIDIYFSFYFFTSLFSVRATWSANATLATIIQAKKRRSCPSLAYFFQAELRNIQLKLKSRGVRCHDIRE